MFIGEYQHSLDAKNRLIIPSRLREELGDTFVVTKGLDGCLTIYTGHEWDKVQKQLDGLPTTNRAARQYIRFMTSGAAECSCDIQGRIQLPQNLVTYAGIDHSCVIIGANDYVEIWSEERWQKYNADTAENFDDLAESLTEYLK